MTGRLGRPLAVLGIALALLVGANLTGDGGSGSAPAPARPVAVDVAATLSTDPVVAVAALQDRLESLPGDWQAWADLGAVHLQQARTTADPSFYARAETAFARSLEEQPEGNDAALVGQAALAASRHDFVDARARAQQAVDINPYSASAHGVLTDALVELGDYDAAFAALQRMLDLRPGVPSYTRASYAFELRGELDRARTSLEQALRIAVDPADAAFAHRYLGELAFSQGDLDEAARQFAGGLDRLPGHPPLLAGRARVAAARGDVEAALQDWTEVVQRLPEPGYLAELGDLYASLGRPAEAEEQYAVVRTTERLFRAAGADLDLEQALFSADHGDPAGALAAAERAWSTQRSVQAADTYAWALHVNGQSAQAREIADSAQRLGTRSALFDYHRGMIELAVGDPAAARQSLASALALNPSFSVLHAPRARAALDQLGGPA